MRTPTSQSRWRLSALALALGATFATLYALEAGLTIANPSWVDRLGTTLRKGPSVVAETLRLRRRGIDAYPFLQPDTFYDSAKAGILMPQGNSLVPLSGIARALTVLCNETGTTIVYRSDSLGFRNPADVWDPIYPDVAIIGDSFAQGFCRPEEETISSQLRAAGLRTIGTGITGAGPLAELGVLREFLAPAKPRIVLWLFYEGNDLIDLASERK